MENKRIKSDKKNKRTCLGCHKKIDKFSLYRIANIKEDLGKEKTIILDLTQKKGGRGAYLCSVECFEKSLEKRFLQKRLRSQLSSEKINEIKEEIKKATRGK